MARKGKPWGPSNPLWRWQHGKGKKTKKAHKKHAKKVHHMARRRSKRRGKHSFKIPVVSLAILGGQALLAHTAGSPVQQFDAFQSYYTGMSFTVGGFHPENLLIGWGPWFTKGLISKVARPLGARPRIPFGLPISIS